MSPEIPVQRAWPLLLLFLGACATLAPGPAPVPADKARVYIYRRAVPIGPVTLHIFDGQKDIGALSYGTYLDYTADTGPRVFKAIVAGSGSMPYATTLNGGRTYFFLAYFLGDQIRGEPALTPMDAVTATDQMKGLKPANPPN